MMSAMSVVAPARHPETLAAMVDDSLVLMSPRDRRLHELNNSARAVWERLEPGATVGEIVSEVAENFEVSASAIRDDIHRLIDRLRGDGLVTDDLRQSDFTRPVRARNLIRADHQLTVRALDAVVGIAVDDAELADALAPILKPLMSTGEPTDEIVVTATRNHLYSLEMPGRTPVIVGSQVAAVLRIVGELNTLAVESVPDHLVLHAGAVATPAGGVLLPAPSNHGKSTLTAALVQRGHGYLTDEAAAVSADLSLRPYPKALALDPGSFELFPEARPDHAGGSLSQAVQEREWHIDPARLGPVSGPCGASLVVSPSWTEGAATTCTRLGPIDALHLLLGQSFEFGVDAQRAFTTLARVAETVPVFRLVYSDLSGGVAEIERRIDDRGFPG